MYKHKLTDMRIGDRAYISELQGVGAMRRRLIDMGFAPKTAIECVGRSPLGGLSAFLVKGAVVALRDEDCKMISILADRRNDNEKLISK